VFPERKYTSQNYVRIPSLTLQRLKRLAKRIAYAASPRRR
jgi:hypothetical protein